MTAGARAAARQGTGADGAHQGDRAWPSIGWWLPAGCRGSRRGANSGGWARSPAGRDGRDVVTALAPVAAHVAEPHVAGGTHHHSVIASVRTLVPAVPWTMSLISASD